MGMLNAKNVFGMPAMASSFFNIGSICRRTDIGILDRSAFRPTGAHWRGFRNGAGRRSAAARADTFSGLACITAFGRTFAWRDAGVKAILLLMGPSVIAASTTQFNVLINSMFASSLGDGPITWLSIAFRLMQLPLGLFGVALGTVTLPLLSRLVVAQRMDAFRAELARAMRLAFLLAIPSTVGLVMLAEPIISVVYQHGKFNAYEAEQAAGALRFYAIGLAGYAALKVLVNAFYALERRKTPMLVSFLAVGLNLLFNWIFTFRLGWGHRGLAFSTGCIASCNFVLLYILMQRQLQGLETRRMMVLLVKMSVSCGALALVCAASTHWLLRDWRTDGLWIKTAALLATITVAALVFTAVSFLVRIEEMRELLAAAGRRFRRA